MKRREALKRAGEVAEIMRKYAHLYVRRNFGTNGGYNKEMRIFEVILFGSTAEKNANENVRDINILIIDNEVFFPKYAGPGTSRIIGSSWFNFCDFVEETEIDSGIINGLSRLIFRSNIDMHIIPLKFFKNKEFRDIVKSEYTDPKKSDYINPNFFKNVFSTAMRWQRNKQFIPVDVSYFERKYKVRLQDLKK